MKDIKTKEDVKKLLIKNPDTGNLRLRFGAYVDITEELWYEVDDEEAKMFLIGALHQMKCSLIEKIEKMERRIE